MAFAQGPIEMIEDTWGEALIRGKSAEIRIKFFEGRRPPGVKSGQTVCVVGRCTTSNLGQDFALRDCLLISGTGFRRALSNLIKKYAVAPKFYMDLPIEFADLSKKK